MRFGAFEVDLRAGELRKGGVRLKLQEQPLQILQILLENPGEVVTREELRQRLWASDTFVDFEQGLYNAIKRLREALGDSAENPRFIETVPRRGYRFMAPLVENAAGFAAPAQEVASVVKAGPELRRWHWRNANRLLATLAFAVLLLGAFLGASWGKLRQWFPPGSGSPQIRSLAVIPLTNLSGDQGQEYFSDGITDALITELAQIGSIRVISRTSSEQYKRTRKLLPEIGRELNVDGIIEGTVQRSGDRVRVTAQLIQVPADKHLWANSYERDLRDAFLLERDVAGDIARQVQVRLNSKRQPLAQPRPVNPTALEAYLQGNAHMHKFKRGVGDEELRLATVFFQQAIDAEPDFARAYVGLSGARGGTLRSSSEDVDIAMRAAERAVEIDPNLPDAWITRAGFKCAFWDWRGAEQDYRRR
jgi:TolB-like protein/DNA-binding winged helix-turn-helix (wHTH) protein